jgi:hypothetical protein
MSRLELIAILFVIVLYLWWRVRRRMAQVKAAFRGQPEQARQAGPAGPAPTQLTLEKDPVTGVYRPPKG